MADIHKCTRDDDPNRCQAVNSHGQCYNLAYTNSTFCLAHGGNKAGQATEKKQIRNYLLGKWQARIDQGLAAPNLKSIRDEIVILRMLLEKRMELCDSNTDLLLHSGALSDLVMKIEKVVSSCHKLETLMGMTMDKQAMLNFASNIIGIVASVLQGQDEVITEISNRIVATLAVTDGGEDVSDQ